MPTKSEIAAKASEYDLFIAPRPYSFELDNDLLAQLRQEFDPPLIVAKLAQAIKAQPANQIDSLAEGLFGEYGRTLMRRTLALGEQYPDRTYEMLKEAADQTGELVFPLILQRFIEIAYLSTQQFRILPIVENWADRLVYQVKDCYMYKQLQEQCGSAVSEAMVCRHSCLGLAKAGCQGLGVEAGVSQETTMAKDGSCRFVIART